MSLKTYHGSCHCGTVQFEADIDLSNGTTRCNCSFCSKLRAWYAFVPVQQFRPLWGHDMQTEYQWTPVGQTAPALHYRFCKICGIGTPGVTDHGPDGTPCFVVPVTLLDDADADELAASIRYVDGRHGRFDQTPQDVRLL